MNQEIRELIEKSKGIRLLYVEDHLEIQEVVLAFLSIFFKNITTALDGREALEKFQSDKFDLIITDIQMPNMNGLEFIKEVRSLDSDISILIFSAFNDQNYLLDSIRYGVDGYLLKPFNSEQFLFTLGKVLVRIEKEKELHEYHQRLEEMVQEKTKELEYRCLHEYYTDLPNSIMLQNDLLSQNFEYMLLLDISHFSVLNKEYGKEFATHVIIRTARILERHIHKKAKLYKTESDRFAILTKVDDIDSIKEYCDQIVSFFDTKNIHVDDTELHLTFNIGVDKVRADISETLVNCEYAIDKSKELGSRHYEIYQENVSVFSDEKEAIKWLRLTRELVLNEKIEPYFQPIEDVLTGEVKKYEALARGIINDEIIAPFYFIKPAEKLGLSSAITKLMINKTFKFFQDNEMEFSINLTERDLLEGYLEVFLTEKLEQYNINPERVTFEILENITIAKNSKQITEELNLLRDMGFKLAVDDFGIENSNFSRLLEIRLDFIKIDGIFIKNLKVNDRNRTITAAIVNLAKTLGIKTVAEYVEDEFIYDIIKECGIDYAQGYHIGKPESTLLSR